MIASKRMKKKNDEETTLKNTHLTLVKGMIILEEDEQKQKISSWNGAV